jgi:streptogramin lyase
MVQAHGQAPGSRAPELRLPGEPPPPFLLKWGTSGTGAGELDAPMGMAVDASGNVYVADSVNDRIQKFDSGGTFIAQWGTHGTGDGELFSPYDVAIDAWGNVYVADAVNHRIQKFDGNGTFLTKWGENGTGEGQLAIPNAVAVDASGNVYVSDRDNYRIQKFDGNGTFQMTWGWGVDDGTSALQQCTSGCQQGIAGSGDGQLQPPVGVAVDVEGMVYVADSYNHRIQKFDSSGAYIGKWGAHCETSLSGADGCDGEFYFPIGVAADTAGNVHVVDGGNQRIQKFDGSGTFLTRWGQSGASDGQFSNPRGVAVDASGNVYVADTDNDRIQKFGPPYESLVFILKWGTYGTGDGEFDSPVDAAIDGSGNVYIVDYLNQRIQKFDSSGAYLTQWGSSGTGDGDFLEPYGAATDAAGNVYVVDISLDRIQKFDSSGTFLAKWGSTGTTEGQFDQPYGVAVDASGNIYVADTANHRVQKLDSSGTFSIMWGWGVDDGTNELQQCTSGCQAGIDGFGTGQFLAPHDVAVDASGNVYVIDYGNQQLHKFDSSGNFITAWGGGGAGDGQFDRPHTVGVDTAGNVYVADTYNHRIQKFDSSGTFLTKWGLQGSGDGQFVQPRGVAIDAAGNVYVADTNNGRVQKFGPCGFTMTPFSEFFAVGGGAGSFNIDAVVDTCGWTATASQSWITVTSGAAGTDAGLGDGAIEFSVDANPTALSRGGYIHVFDESTGGPGVAFSVIQDPAPCTYSIDPTEAGFYGGAGADFVSVTSLLGCAWTAVSNDGWISVDAGATGNGDGVVLYSVAANPGATARSGTMTIAGQTFTVNQDPQVPAPPSNLAGAAVNSTKINLTWDDNAGNEAWVRIERRLAAAGTFARVLTVPADTTGAQDSPVRGNTSYVYRVMACNSAGCSDPSAEVEVTTPALGIFIGEEEGRE